MWSILLSAWDISSLLSFRPGWSSRHWEQHNRWILLLSQYSPSEDEDWGQVSDRSHDILGSTRQLGSGPVQPQPIRGQCLVTWPPQPITGQCCKSVTWPDLPGLCSLATWRKYFNFLTMLDFWVGLVDRKQKTENRKHYEINIKTGNTDFRLTVPPPSSDARKGGKTCRNSPPIGFC